MLAWAFLQTTQVLMLQLYISLDSVFCFILWCDCAYAPFRFRHKKHLGVWKASCSGLQCLYWLSQRPYLKKKKRKKKMSFVEIYVATKSFARIHRWTGRIFLLNLHACFGWIFLYLLSQHCAYAALRFRHNNHFIRFRKTLGFCLNTCDVRHDLRWPFWEKIVGFDLHKNI